MKLKARLLASIKIWIAIYPSITLFLFLSGSHLNILPLYLRTLLLTVVLVPWVVFVCIPLIDLLCNKISSSIKNNSVQG